LELDSNGHDEEEVLQQVEEEVQQEVEEEVQQEEEEEVQQVEEEEEELNATPPNATPPAQCSFYQRALEVRPLSYK
jgi:hypothetical protein